MYPTLMIACGSWIGFRIWFFVEIDIFKELCLPVKSKKNMYIREFWGEKLEGFFNQTFMYSKVYMLTYL